MKYIILILSLFLVSCSNQSDSIEWFWYKDNWVDFSHTKESELPEYRFTEMDLEGFWVTTYNSWKILSVQILEEKYREADKLNLETMQVEISYWYKPASACSFVYCYRYKLLVMYDSSFTKVEYVYEHREISGNYYRDLRDDSEFYKNK